jgi:hypothetical protein
MRLLVLSACLLAGFATAASAVETGDPLARARLLYNQRDFAGAVAAADEGRSAPGRADSADLIAARAYLEQFRASAAPDDLTAARDRLRRIDAGHLDANELNELVVGLGETLYFDESTGAAADLFDSLLARPSGLAPDARERVLDWWATAVDRDARPRPDIERQTVYQRVRDRMNAELAENPTSAVAAYWLSAAALGQGDQQAAWDAALAGWVRAPLAVDRGAALRGDLDLLVERGIAPERSRMLSQPVESIRADWERFKDKWNK